VSEAERLPTSSQSQEYANNREIFLSHWTGENQNVTCSHCTTESGTRLECKLVEPLQGTHLLCDPTLTPLGSYPEIL
jgi:hypothetical protein